MALTTTTIAAAQTATDLAFKATSATGATVGGFAKVDGEYQRILAIDGTTIKVARRGEFGGKVVAHNILAPCVFGLDSDLASPGTYEVTPVPYMEFDMVNIGANGVIPVPTRNTHFFINKGSALASSTFADPSASQNGLMVTFTGTTDFAHVVTTVNAHDGTTGAHTTLTSAAFAGSSVTLIAQNAKWYVVSNNLWVIT